MTVPVCDACGGMWVDNISAERIVRSLEATIAAISKRLANGLPVHVGGTRRLACPICGEQMAVRPVAKAAVEVDVCDSHGTWFDAGELGRVIDALHPSAAQEPDPLPEVDEELLQHELDTWKRRDKDDLIEVFWRIVGNARIPAKFRLF